MSSFSDIILAEDENGKQAREFFRINTFINCMEKTSAVVSAAAFGKYAHEIVLGFELPFGEVVEILNKVPLTKEQLQLIRDELEVCSFDTTQVAELDQFFKDKLSDATPQ